MRLLTTLAGLVLSGFVLAAPIQNVVVFGDSLSDNGNFYEFMKHQLPQSPPYYKGRFTNGPVWVEQLLATYYPPNQVEGHLLDYAFGGAGVSEDENDNSALFTLQKEMNNYFLAHKDKASADSLYVMWIGSNNYFGVPSDSEKAIRDNINGITRGLKRLVAKGAQHILVVNLPDLGKTPAALELDVVKELRAFTHRHNELLTESLQQLKQENPGVQWLFFDVNEAFTEVVDQAAIYGFTNVQDSCNSAVMSVKKPSILHMVRSVQAHNQSDNCEGYLFFDLVHPTALAHHYVAEKARRLLDAAGIEMGA